MAKKLLSGRRGAIIGLLLVLIGLLAACDDPPVDRRKEIEKAVRFSGGPEIPTVNPTVSAREAFGFTLSIYNFRDYYPDRPDEKIGVDLINHRETSFYLSRMCHMILQHQVGKPEDKQWEDIAFGRPCPPGDSQTFQLYPGTSIKSDFVFSETRPLSGKSWKVPGTYRLLLNYFMRCPDAYSTISYCEDRHSYDSTEFQIKLDKVN